MQDRQVSTGGAGTHRVSADLGQTPAAQVLCADARLALALGNAHAAIRCRGHVTESQQLALSVSSASPHTHREMGVSCCCSPSAAPSASVVCCLSSSMNCCRFSLNTSRWSCGCVVGQGWQQQRMSPNPRSARGTASGCWPAAKQVVLDLTLCDPACTAAVQQGIPFCCPQEHTQKGIRHWHIPRAPLGNSG